uniref:Uncharacterized protein n=1 Tax=Ditylenchus dipsaci TaxID=166011 RepID=A0A915EBP2_9BILA
MDSLLSGLIDHLSNCIYHIGSLAHKLLLLLIRNQPGLLADQQGKEEEPEIFQLHKSAEETILLPEEEQDQAHLTMKKVRFSDEEDNLDGEVAAFAGYNNILNNQMDAANGGDSGNAQNSENGESMKELRARLKEQQEHIQMLSETLKRVEETGVQQPQGLRGVNHLINSTLTTWTRHKQVGLAIDELEKENQEKETTIDDLRRGLSNALEVASNSVSNGYSEKRRNTFRKYPASKPT